MRKFTLVSVCICLIVGAWAIHVQKASADDSHERRVSEMLWTQVTDLGRRERLHDGSQISISPSALTSPTFKAQ
jgi:hypothetical protein